MGTILVKNALNALKIEVFKKCQYDLRVIFDQCPKLLLGLDVRPAIPNLKVI